jgi:hypothetical protein
MKYYFTLIFIFCIFNISYAQPTDFAYDNKKYKILDFSVNIHSQPNTSAEIVGRLGLYDEIEILENTRERQQIDGVDQYWYKIKFNNIIGYIWGGHCAVSYYIFDMDKNGINDYVYYRYRDHACTIETQDDLFIYINNKRIPVNIYQWNSYNNACYAFVLSEYIYIKLAYLTSADPEYPVEIYRVNFSGEIFFYKELVQTLDNFYKPILEESRYDRIQ